MRRVVCLNAISPKGLELLPEGYEVSEKEVDADAILVRSASMHDMKFSKSLRCIARAGAGVNNIPLERCAEEGIVVFNTPGANANAVKEMVIAGILLAARDIPGGMQWCLENKEDPTIGKDMEKAKKAFAGHEIIGKKLGVIGLGAIGAEVANAAAALGMEVYGYDPFISVNSAWNLARDVKHINTVDTIYKECDYITVHVPAMDSTKGMIDKKALDEMKDKLDPAEVSDLQSGVDKVKEALKGTDTEAIKSATESLTQSFYKVSEKMYAQASAAAGQQPGPDMGGANFGGQQQPGPGPDDVVDADYTVVDDQ